MTSTSRLIKVELVGRDSISAEITQKNGLTFCKTLTGLGCSEFLNKISEIRSQLTLPVEEWTDLVGTDHSSILLRELKARMLNQWEEIDPGVELCHCRKVLASVVDSAIVGGALTLKQVQEETSACTACGTCQPRIELLFQKRI
jgi:bacterioferritin-associated ferredoxin